MASTPTERTRGSGFCRGGGGAGLPVPGTGDEAVVIHQLDDFIGG